MPAQFQSMRLCIAISGGRAESEQSTHSSSQLNRDLARVVSICLTHSACEQRFSSRSRAHGRVMCIPRTRLWS